jgi:hypothetical protein
MHRLHSLWRHFWFEPTPPVNLSLCRVLFYGGLFLSCLGHDFSAWSEVSSVFWQPIWLFRWFHLPLLPGELLDPLQLLWKAALGFSCIGLCTRFSTVTAFVLSVYFLGLPRSFGGVSHVDCLPVFVLGIMALSRCGDSGSVDRLMRRVRHGSDPAGNPRGLSGEYTWPVRMVWVMMALIFFAAGVAKLRHSGMEWVYSLEIFLVQNQYHVTYDPLTSWGPHLAQQSWLCRLLAAGTLAIEVGFPLALCSRPIRWIVVPASVLMLIGIQLLLGPAFGRFMIAYLFWVPWDRVVAAFAARQTRAPAAGTALEGSLLEGSRG